MKLWLLCRECKNLFICTFSDGCACIFQSSCLTGTRPSNSTQDGYPNAGEEDLDPLPLFDFSIILSSTNNFYHVNKIGEGGFGAVYKVFFSTSAKFSSERNLVTVDCTPLSANWLKLSHNQLQGELPTGQEIAVKRLSKDSGQGLKEFKNEVIVISKLQHRNLVRLLGCCIHGEERMLIYEYVPKRSLDLYLFS